MSQYVKVNCQVLDNVNPALFRKMIRELDAEAKYDLDTSSEAVKNNPDVDCILTRKGFRLPIGFKFEKSSGKTKLSVRGDFWGTGLEPDSFRDTICQHYQLHNIIQQEKKLGHKVVEHRVTKEGKIILRVA